MLAAELSGQPLDYAVASVEGCFKTGSIGEVLVVIEGRCAGGFATEVGPKHTAWPSQVYHPSTDWAVGGHLIEKYKITLRYDWRWVAELDGEESTGSTPLIAVCRAVANTLGDIPIPDTIRKL